MAGRNQSVFERHSRAADESGFPEHLSVAERKLGAAADLDELRRAGAEVSPVLVHGRAIATGPLGRAWCDAVDALPAAGSRLSSARSYVRSGSVIDLRIEPGRVRALVRGTERYRVEIALQAPVQPELLPAPGVFEANCTCPDFAPVCKHALAALYAVATRLDADPTVLTCLRAPRSSTPPPTSPPGG